MATSNYLLVGAEITAGNKLSQFSDFRYTPFSCEDHEVDEAVKLAAAQQPNVQIIGVLSEDMIAGMQKTISDFKRGL